MGLLSKREFGDKCGIATNSLATYLRRGKVVIGADEKFDDTNPVNAAFVLKRQAKKPEGKIEKEITPVSSSTALNQAPTPKPKKSGKEKKKESDRFEKRFEIDTTEKEKKIGKLSLDSEILQIKRDRLMGKVIPTDIVKDLFSRHFKAMSVANKQGMDEIVLEFSKKAKMNRNDIAELKGHILRVMNKATDNAISESRKELKNIILEYSQSEAE